jgi:FMN phosphatase YigB (HAD superfamily)
MITASAFDAIIFDLGQVIVDLKRDSSIKAFQKIFNISPEAVLEIYGHEDANLFELGQISDAEFFGRLNKRFQTEAQGLEIMATAWDAMIGDVTLETINILHKLKLKCPLYALSNTNSTHIKAINRALNLQHNIKDIRELFTKVYFSYELNLSKPDKKIYEYVLKENGLNASKTLFIDDIAENIAAARELGLKTIHLTQKSRLGEELVALGLL